MQEMKNTDGKTNSQTLLKRINNSLFIFLILKGDMFMRNLV